MNSRRLLHVPVLLTAALLALLAFAGSASAAAETRTGESTTVVTEGSPTAETLLTKATASFETATGHAVLAVTTAAPPSPAANAEMLAGFSTAECSTPIPGAGLESALFPLISSYPLLVLETAYSSPAAVALTGSISAPMPLPAEKTVSGATTTLSTTSGTFVEAGFKCAIVLTAGESGGSVMSFPIKAPPPPPPAPTPPPAPPVLSIVKPQTQKLKVSKWKTVHVKVTNTGPTASVQGSLRVKPTKGVLVKPEVQKLPVLAPGASWSISVQVQLTKKAKKSSKLPVTATASGVTATSSLVVKLKE